MATREQQLASVRIHATVVPRIHFKSSCSTDVRHHVGPPYYAGSDTEAWCGSVRAFRVMRRVCVITGASGYLGTAWINRYAERYQIVAVHHQRPVQFPTQEQQFIDPLAPSAPVDKNECAVHSIRADLTQPSDIERLCEVIVRRFGQVDLLINGAARRDWSPLLAPDALRPMEALMSLNVFSPLRLSVGLARRAWQLDRIANVLLNRNVVNISSIAGLFVYPDLGQSLYATSKAALNHLTYHLASEFWDIGIRVNAVA